MGLENATQLAKIPPIFYFKLSNKVYLFGLNLKYREDFH